jgi:hypothetical protein
MKKINMIGALAVCLLSATMVMGDTCQPESLETWVRGDITCTYQGLTFSGFYANHYDPSGEFTPVTFNYDGEKYVGFRASNIGVYLGSPGGNGFLMDFDVNAPGTVSPPTNAGNIEHAFLSADIGYPVYELDFALAPNAYGGFNATQVCFFQLPSSELTGLCSVNSPSLMVSAYTYGPSSGSGPLQLMGTITAAVSTGPATTATPEMSNVWLMLAGIGMMSIGIATGRVNAMRGSRKC